MKYKVFSTALALCVIMSMFPSLAWAAPETNATATEVTAPEAAPEVAVVAPKTGAISISATSDIPDTANKKPFADEPPNKKPSADEPSNNQPSNDMPPNKQPSNDEPAANTSTPKQASAPESAPITIDDAALQELALKAQTSVPATGYYKFTTKNKLCLEVPNAETANGVQLQLYKDNGHMAQKFRVISDAETGYFYAYNVFSQCAWDLKDRGKANGTPVQQWTHAAGAPTQQFQLEDAGGGNYYIKSGVNTYLTVKGTPGNCSKIVTTKDVKKALKWRYEKVSGSIFLPDGNYSFYTPKGNYLDIQGGSLDNGAKLWLYKKNNSTAEKFTLKINQKTNYFYIKNVNSGKSIDIEGGDKAKVGNQPQQWDYWGGKNQRFCLEAAGGGWYYLHAARGGYLAASADKAEAGLFTTNNQAKALKVRYKAVKVLDVSGMRIYIAYASNLNLSDMSWRCPNARLLGTSMLKNYRLLFRGPRAATVEATKGWETPVAIFSITPSDERSLDAYENYPSAYVKKNVTVTLEGQTIDGFVYVTTWHSGIYAPAPGYYNTIRQGYIDCGFDLAILKRAAYGN